MISIFDINIICRWYYLLPGNKLGALGKHASLKFYHNYENFYKKLKILTTIASSVLYILKIKYTKHIEY